MITPEIITVEEMSDRLGFSVDVVRAMIESNDIPVIFSGQKRMVARNDFEEWINKRNKLMEKYGRGELPTKAPLLILVVTCPACELNEFIDEGDYERPFQLLNAIMTMICRRCKHPYAWKDKLMAHLDLRVK